jgi:hypothetical protein
MVREKIVASAAVARCSRIETKRCDRAAVARDGHLSRWPEKEEKRTCKRIDRPYVRPGRR